MLCYSPFLPLKATKNICIEVYLLKPNTCLVSALSKLFQAKSYILTNIRLSLDYTLASKIFPSLMKVSKTVKLYLNHICKKTAKYTAIMWPSWLPHWLSLGPMNLVQWIKCIVYISIYQLELNYLVKFSVCVYIGFSVRLCVCISRVT